VDEQRFQNEEEPRMSFPMHWVEEYRVEFLPIISDMKKIFVEQRIRGKVAIG